MATFSAIYGEGTFKKCCGFDFILFSTINTCCTNNDVTYIIMPRRAQESSVYLFPLWSKHGSEVTCSMLLLISIRVLTLLPI